MKYLNLASGAAHFLSPEVAVKNTIAALQNNETFYRETEGMPALRKSISKRYQEDYLAGIPVENILITSGTKQALFNLFSILLKPGDEVILPEPGWFGFIEIFKVLHLKPVFLETKLDENFSLDPEQLKESISEKTRLFIFSNPGNPTGRVYTKPEIQAWLNVLEKFPQIKILSDEIYDLIVFEKTQVTSLSRFPDPQKKHIIVNGFSKNFGMSGWRIGYMIASPEIIKMATHFQQVTISGVNPFIQEGAVAALENRNNFLPERIDELLRNREILINWLDKLGFPYFKPQAAYYVFADLSKLFASGNFQRNGITSTEKLCEILKQELQLELQPGEKFNAPNQVRITFAVPENDLKVALERMENFFGKT